MTKKEIQNLTNSELFSEMILYNDKVVKEANSRGGETKKTLKVYNYILNECINRFNLDRQVLIDKHVISE